MMTFHPTKDVMKSGGAALTMPDFFAQGALEMESVCNVEVRLFIQTKDVKSVKTGPI